MQIKLIFFFLLIPILLFSQKKVPATNFQIAIKNKSDVFTIEPNFKKAQYFFLQKEWDSTLIYSMKQLSLKSENKGLNNYCHLFRGYGFKEKNVFKEARQEFEKISNEFEFYPHVNIKMGEMALKDGDYNGALKYFRTIEKNDSDELLGLKKYNIEQNIGSCYILLKKYALAEKYFQQSLTSQELVKDTLDLARSYMSIANLYYNQYKDEIAIPNFEKAYELSKKVNNFQLKRTAARNMAVVEENRKNFSESIRYRKEYEKWNDSLNNQSKIWEVAQVEKEFAIKEKQKEVSLLQAENKAKIAERNGFLYTAIALLLLLLTSMYFYREKVKATKIITAQKEDLDALNATKDQILSILSHDLRSSIIALKYSNRLLSDELAPEKLDNVNTLLDQNSTMVNTLYNLLDNLLHWALSQTKQSYFDISSLRLFAISEQVVYNYLPLMKEKNITFTNTVLKSDTIQADQESLKIVLRNLVDNAIKFSNQDGTIALYTQSTHDKYCDLVVEDTGTGMEESTRLELLKDSVLLAKKEHEDIIGTGLGLQLCKTMIKKNKGIFSIESTLGKGTKMIVSLPKA